MEYTTLLSSAGINSDSAGSRKIRGAPYSFPYAGFVLNGSLGGVDSSGYYWSSTAYGSDYANDLVFDSGVVNADYNNRFLGLSIRCIAP